MAYARLVAIVLLITVLVPSQVAADPAITSPAPDLQRAEWSFSNPADYGLANATVGPSDAALAWSTATFADTTAEDFGFARLVSNVYLTTSPGDVLIADTSQLGPPQSLVFQPGPVTMADNYIATSSSAATNFGVNDTLKLGFGSNPDWSRTILRFPTLPMPSNATLLAADLSLFLYAADTPDSMPISIHAMTDNWTETGSTWDTRDGVFDWNASGGGGDFDPSPLDLKPGIGNASGWYTFEITTAAVDWWSGRTPNFGLLVRQADDDSSVSRGHKLFRSSDTSNASARPFLTLTYATPSSVGMLESRIFDAGSSSMWGSIGWTATLPPGATIEVRTRSGPTLTPDGTWSPWSSSYLSPGIPVVSPPSRYLEYRVRLFTPTATSPVLRDVSIAGGHFAASGTVQTASLDPPGLLGWGLFEANWIGPLGTGVAFGFSQDDGASWSSATPGAELPGALVKPVRLRAILTTTNTTLTPTVHAFAVTYRVPSEVLGFSTALPWLLLSLVLIPLAWTIVRRMKAKPFRPTDLYLIHADGRLILRIGTSEGPVQDELAASGMFTLVAQFVRDSFGGASGASGELKSLTVDNREVAIAKGTFLFLALVFEGSAPIDLDRRMAEFLDGIEAGWGPTLRAWDGLREPLADLEAPLVWFLHTGHLLAHPRPPIPSIPLGNSRGR